MPPHLERRLKEIFPAAKDREEFLLETLENALEEVKPAEGPVSVGGTLHLFSDGGSRGNPGQAAVACILEDPNEGRVLKEHYETIGIETNNVAEYRALIAGLKIAREYHPNRLICHLDSELIVRQLSGQYQVKMATLKAYYDEIQALSKELPDVVFVHIPREDNYRADALVNKALDQSGIAKPAYRRPHASLFTLLLLAASFYPQVMLAASPLTYRYKHDLFTIDLKEQEQWETPKEIWMYGEREIVPPQEMRIDGDRLPAPPENLRKVTVPRLDEARVTASLERIIGQSIRRSQGAVRITRSATGAIAFDGVGFPGRDIDIDQLVILTIEAMRAGVADILLPVIETPPNVVVDDAELRAMGIGELVTIGESDFSHSPANRIHNIKVGMSKFSGHLIPQGGTFSFGKTIGPIGAADGFLKELVIKGDRTVPDYGGGLCQVSTTAYRGIWEYGFPIVQRKNHSFSVSHYFPQGTDATVYPPDVDMKFLNDSPGALVMQTHIEGTHAYFLYYGTHDDRKTSLFGPFIWNRTGIPANRTEFTTDLKPGEKKKVGDRVQGLDAAWFRIVERPGTGELLTRTYSHYQARPLYMLVGADPLQFNPIPPQSGGSLD